MKKYRLSLKNKWKGLTIAVATSLAMIFALFITRVTHTHVSEENNRDSSGIVKLTADTDSIPEWNDATNPDGTDSDGNSVAYPEYKFEEYYNCFGHRSWWNGTDKVDFSDYTQEETYLQKDEYKDFYLSFTHASGASGRYYVVCYGPGAVRGLNDSNGTGSIVIPASVECYGTQRLPIEFDRLGNGLPIVFYDGNQDGIYTKNISFADDNKIKAVSKFAFYNNPYIETVDLSNCTNLTTIEEGAFMNCKNLKRVILPNSVTKIEKNAFAGCTKLVSTSSEIMNLTNVTYIGPGAFKGDTGTDFTTIQLSSSIETLGAHAFYGCTRLQEIEVPASITNVGDYAFSQCTSMNNAKVYNKKLSEGEFSECTSLARIYLNDEITTISASCFKNSNAGEVNYITKLPTATDSMEAGLGFPHSLTTIEEYAFYGSSIKEVSLPDATTTVGDYAFALCKVIASVDLNKITLLKSHAFDGITSDKFTNITIPETLINTYDSEGEILTGIDEYAFANSSYLVSATFKNADLGAYMFAGSSRFTTVTFNKLS